jgi:hypothetical protein
MHRHDTHHGHGPRGPSRRSRHLGSGRTSVQNTSERVAKAHPPPHARAVGSESRSSAATVRAAVGHEVFAPFSQSRELYEQRDHADPPHPRQHEGRAKFRLRQETRNSPEAGKTRPHATERWRCSCRLAVHRACTLHELVTVLCAAVGFTDDEHLYHFQTTREDFSPVGAGACTAATAQSPARWRRSASEPGTACTCTTTWATKLCAACHAPNGRHVVAESTATTAQPDETMSADDKPHLLAQRQLADQAGWRR